MPIQPLSLEDLDRVVGGASTGGDTGTTQTGTTDPSDTVIQIIDQPQEINDHLHDQDGEPGH